ncbi:SUKH superfamily protein [Lachnotalea glycerini]|uniref:SUKH superfamily protein n=1 Tax=Lachnotalea glycerini TaxID=1763509 RepID=A0A318EHJ3_9FIRM|nr:SMI1/KNR4 family protein [Lachnotalea glycerini]PXV83702.1 SUKH superfamily protein [Lachnotalea glycerini]
MVNNKLINEYEINYGMRIPNLYKDFLKVNDGFSFDGGKILYSLNDLKEMNDNLQIHKYQPDYIAIGDDGGGLVFLMKQEANAEVVFLVDMSDYEIETAYKKISNFNEWFNRGCNIDTEENEKNNKLSKIGSVYLTKKPVNGIKDLAIIKQIFNLNIATSQLLTISKTLPCELLTNIKYVKAIKLIEKTGQPEIFEFRLNK